MTENWTSAGVVLVVAVVLSAVGCQRAPSSCSDHDDCFKGEYCTDAGVCASGEAPDAGPRDADGGGEPDGEDGGGGDVADGGPTDAEQDATDAVDATDTSNADAADAPGCRPRPDGGCGCLYNGTNRGVCAQAVRSPETGSCQKPDNYEGPEESSCDDLDNDCDGRIDEELPLSPYYLDDDGDGFGDTAEELETCRKPDGYVENSDDCDDSDADAHPNQTDYFSEPRNGGGYDYDCSGNETRERTTTNACGGSASSSEACDRIANDPNGWRQGGIPECGELGDWITDCTHQTNPSRCTATDTRLQQKCH